jgi:hypothetical protein
MLNLVPLAIGFGAGVLTSIYAPKVWRYLQTKAQAAVDKFHGQSSDE